MRTELQLRTPEPGADTLARHRVAWGVDQAVPPRGGVERTSAEATAAVSRGRERQYVPAVHLESTRSPPAGILERNRRDRLRETPDVAAGVTREAGRHRERVH